MSTSKACGARSKGPDNGRKVSGSDAGELQPLYEDRFLDNLEVSRPGKRAVIGSQRSENVVTENREAF